MKKRRNVAMVGVGIVGIPVLTEILKLISEEVDITIYSFIPIDKNKVPSGIRVRYLPRPIHQRIKYALLLVLFSFDHLRRKYDVVHAQSAFPGGVFARIVGKLFGLPWMVTLIGGETEAMPHIPFGDLLNPALRPITTTVCSEAHALTTMSRYQADRVRNSLRINREIRVLPYAPPVGQYELKNVTFPVQLLHVGYHHPVKNQQMLLDTAAALVGKVPFNLTIVGDNFGQVFRDTVVRMNLSSCVFLVGPQPYKEIFRFLKHAHVLLHTSWYEGLPTVAFEAMANGLVVCGTHVGILADFSGTHCRTVPPGDSSALADAILDLVHDEVQYEKLRTTAYAWAKENDSRYYCREMIRLYQTLPDTMQPL